MMDIIFKKAMDEYLEMVEDTCEELLNDINKNTQIQVRDIYDLLGYKSSNLIQDWILEEKLYRFHGSGCAVYEGKEKKIDWDYGFRGRWCGIEPIKTAQTLIVNNSIYKEYYSADNILEMCEAYCATGEMFKVGNQYYFDLLKQGCITPSFPEEYDSLIVSYHGYRKQFQRTKLIDKFIRKSVKIYDRIEELNNNFELDFYQGEESVFKIYYNVMAYPENAVKILTDQIIKPLIKLNWWSS